MKFVKNLPRGTNGLLALIEIGLFGCALYCLMPYPKTSGIMPDAWLFSSIAFLLSKVLARRRGAETWISVFGQTIIFAIFAYILLNG